MSLAISVDGLHKRYGGVAALAGIDLAVPPGVIFGLLGPNGAGKTTAVRILATLVRADCGRAVVAGYDVATQPGRVRERIGVVGQQTALDELLSAEQNLVMFARLYHLETRAARRRAGELLDRFGLADAATLPVKEYSGGMRRRLDLAASLIVTPPVLFLDEPTTGLDPRGRNDVWAAVRGLVAGGTTVLLTTQYLDEADQLADRVGVIDSGRVITEGTPAALKQEIGADRLDIVVTDAGDIASAAALLARVAGSAAEVDPDARRVSLMVSDQMSALVTVVRELDRAGIAADDIAVRRPTLDEVFLRLTASEPGGRSSRVRSEPPATAQAEGAVA